MGGKHIPEQYYVDSWSPAFLANNWMTTHQILPDFKVCHVPYPREAPR